MANFILVGIYSEEMAVDPNLEFWLRSGWNSAATVLNILATILGMWIGTITKPTPLEEENRVNSFFNDLKKPFQLEAAAKDSSLSPFKIIGFTLAVFGVVIVLIALLVLLVYHNTQAFRLDLILGFALLLLGSVMWMKSKKRSI